nr:serine/threonine-protein kinase Nek5-like isoform X2 [Procambarus clarkii]
MSRDELEKTWTEVAILARCKHSSIIRYKEYFMLEGPATMCLVMEYADGGDLSLRVKAARRKGEMLDEHSILYWFVQVIFAVQYLHVNNILHRDLKTQNIFLTKSNLVKVGDFGIARFLRGRQDLATTAVGTPYYLSPEICQRQPYNQKSDMWAVGCVLYELGALRHPFESNCFEDLVMKILRGSYRPLPQKFSSLVQDLVQVMLRTQPQRRPSADALLVLPALKPYVENYLKHEELISQCSRPHCGSGGTEENNKDTLRRQKLSCIIPRVQALKKRPREGHGSVDLGLLCPRQEATPNEDAENFAAAAAACIVRPRCASDSAVGRDPPTPTPTTVAKCVPKLGLEGDHVFLTPQRILPRNKVKKRVDTPVPKGNGRDYYPSCLQPEELNQQQVVVQQQENQQQQQVVVQQQENRQVVVQLQLESERGEEQHSYERRDSLACLQNIPSEGEWVGGGDGVPKCSRVGFGVTYVVKRSCEAEPCQ